MRFLCSRGPNSQEILLIGFFCGLRWDGLCGDILFCNDRKPVCIAYRDSWDPFLTFPYISRDVSFECAMLLISGGFCSLFRDQLSIQPRHPWELLADDSKMSLQWRKFFRLSLIWIGKLHDSFTSISMCIDMYHCILLCWEITGSVGNLHKLQDVHAPKLGTSCNMRAKSADFC